MLYSDCYIAVWLGNSSLAGLLAGCWCIGSFAVWLSCWGCGEVWGYWLVAGFGE